MNDDDELLYDYNNKNNSAAITSQSPRAIEKAHKKNLIMFKKSTTRVGFSEDTAYTLITHPTTICEMSDYRIKEAAKHVCDSRDISSSWLASVIEFVIKKIHFSESRSILCGRAASEICTWLGF